MGKRGKTAILDAYLFFFFTTRIFCSSVIHRGLSSGELVLKESAANLSTSF